MQMTVTDFFNKLDNVAHSYHWDVTSNNKVVATIRSGPNKGFTLNPITALAHKSGYGLIENTRDGSETAGSLLGMTRKQARNIYSATIGSHNRGNTQVVRGRIRSALEV
tara:strand:- start:1316 stop:1642 length:327 start_codon:yes stop_codon:yes gene_type:complete